MTYRHVYREIVEDSSVPRKLEPRYHFRLSKFNATVMENKFKYNEKKFKSAFIQVIRCNDQKPLKIKY